MKKEKILRQPYGYTKYYLINRMSPYENRIMTRILEKIKMYQHKGEEPQKTLWNHRQFYYDASDLVIYNNTDKLENVLKRLRERTIKLPQKMDKEDAFLFTGMISTYTRKTKDIGMNRGKVLIEIHEVFYQYMLNLAQGYTSFLSKTAFGLSNSYAIAMYYHIRQWLDPQKNDNSVIKINSGKACDVNFDLERIHKYFCLPESYRPVDIKRQILDKAKKELDQKAEVSFNYQTKKEGRKIVGFSFVFYRNRNKKAIIDSIKLTKKEQSFVDNISEKHQLTITEKRRLVGLILKYGYEMIIYVINYKAQTIISFRAKGKTYIEALGYTCEGEKLEKI